MKKIISLTFQDFAYYVELTGSNLAFGFRYKCLMNHKKTHFYNENAKFITFQGRLVGHNKYRQNLGRV